MRGFFRSLFSVVSGAVKSTSSAVSGALKSAASSVAESVSSAARSAASWVWKNRDTINTVTGIAGAVLVATGVGTPIGAALLGISAGLFIASGVDKIRRGKTIEGAIDIALEVASGIVAGGAIVRGIKAGWSAFRAGAGLRIGSRLTGRYGSKYLNKYAWKMYKRGYFDRKTLGRYSSWVGGKAFGIIGGHIYNRACSGFRRYYRRYR